jgi:UrcA family protein
MRWRADNCTPAALWRRERNVSEHFQLAFKTRAASQRILPTKLIVRTIHWETTMKNLTALTTLIAIAGFTASILAAAPANAGPESRSEIVRFSDLNVTDARASAVLYGRMETAAKSVCSGVDAGGSLGARGQYFKCVHLVLSDAIVRVNLPTLNAYAAARADVAAPAIKVARGN